MLIKWTCIIDWRHIRYIFGISRSCCGTIATPMRDVFLFCLLAPRLILYSRTDAIKISYTISHCSQWNSAMSNEQDVLTIYFAYTNSRRYSNAFQEVEKSRRVNPIFARNWLQSTKVWKKMSLREYSLWGYNILPGQHRIEIVAEMAKGGPQKSCFWTEKKKKCNQICIHIIHHMRGVRHRCLRHPHWLAERTKINWYFISPAVIPDNTFLFYYCYLLWQKWQAKFT